MENIAVNVENVTKTFNIEQKKSFSKFLNLKNSYKQNTLTALDNISFQVKSGEILGILGLNGSGKSTLLRIIAGVYQADSGSVQVNGRLSPLMQLGAGFQGEFIAKDNIIMNGMLLGLPKPIIEQRVDQVIEFAELEEFTNMKVKHYSSGMISRLAFATAIQIDPEILLVDEILGIGDWQFGTKSYNAFLSLKKNKKTILHATHNLEKVSEFSDKALLLHKGKMIMIGKPDEVIDKYTKLNELS